MPDNDRNLMENDQTDEFYLPEEMPILPISEAVIFPAMMVPLVLSDNNLVRLADDCLAGDKILGTFAQKELVSDEEDELDEKDLIYHVGTAVKIQKMFMLGLNGKQDLLK